MITRCTISSAGAYPPRRAYALKKLAEIDRSFVHDMTVAPEEPALMSTIINLAHALKLKVVAEGAETEVQSHLLRLLGCDEIQGFIQRIGAGRYYRNPFLCRVPVSE